MSQIVSFGRRLRDLAAQHPDRIAIVIVAPEHRDQTITFAELESCSNQLARCFTQSGITRGSVVAIALRNSIEYFVASFAIWKLGACVFPLRWDLPDWERERLLAVAKPALLIGDIAMSSVAVMKISDINAATTGNDAPLADVIAQPFRMNATGGSTGTPKIVVSRLPGAMNPEAPWGPVAESLLLKPNQVQLIAGPLYHFGPSSNAVSGLLGSHTVVVIAEFDPIHTLQTIAKYRVQIGMIVPTMLYRIMQLPDLQQYDFSSVLRMSLGGAKCPEWLLRKAIETFGVDKIFTGYGGTENIGSTSVTGAEWLAHPGTVGKGNFAEIKILDANGNTLPVKEIGEIWMRHQGLTQPFFEYIGGATANITADGYASLGDMGWLDDEGYLYIADRRTDMFVSGGANVYPAEIEAALLEHPAIGDIAVVGLPDDEWGARGHAILVVDDGCTAPSVDELREHCLERLARYKVPKTFEFVASLPRDTLGKIRRPQLRDERINNAPSTSNS